MVSDLVSTLGFDKVQKLDVEAAAWLSAHGLQQSREEAENLIERELPFASVGNGRGRSAAEPGAVTRQQVGKAVLAHIRAFTRKQPFARCDRL